MNNTNQADSRELTVSETVRKDYRTAAVFKRYAINYCCGGKWPVGLMCENAGISKESVLREISLETATLQPLVYARVMQWPVSFLSAYIREIYYRYFEHQMPHMFSEIENFAEGHRKKFPFLAILEPLVEELAIKINTCLSVDREHIFPYKGTSPQHGDRVPMVFYTNKESLSAVFLQMRMATENFSLNESSCTSHRVAFSLIREMEAMVTDLFNLEEILQVRINARLQ